jgi:uncharacterized membrane protein (DUF2068 family)
VALRRRSARARTAASSRYELVGCAIHGHELVGTDAARIRIEDELLVREIEGLRWYRCLRCDAWVHQPPPSSPTREVPPDRDEITVPLRGRPLRDRYVLRVIACDRTLRALVLAPVAVAVILFAKNRGRLHGDYTKILAGFQSAFGVPVNNFGTVELNKLFALSTTKLYLAGVAIAVYALLLAVEAVGLWRGRRWAEYLTFLETAVFVPFEIDELTKAVTTLRVLAIVINLAVLAYLLVKKRLFGVRGGWAAEQAHRDDQQGWPAIERKTPGHLEPPA